MTVISGRKEHRSNQLSSDKDLNSIKATIDNDDMAGYQPQQSSRRSNKNGKKYLQLDGRQSPDEETYYDKKKYQKPNINILGPSSGSNQQNAKGG